MESKPTKRARHARPSQDTLNEQQDQWGASAYVPATMPAHTTGPRSPESKKVTGKRVGIALGILVALVAILVGVALFIPWKISYNLDGGTVAGDDNPSSYNMLTSVTLTAPEREGYVFAGWKGTDLEGSQKEVTIPKWSYGSRHYTATWHELINLDVAKVSIRHGDSTVRDENNTVTLTLWGKTGEDSWEELAETVYSESSDLVAMKYSEKSNATKFVLNDGCSTFENIEDAFEGYLVTAASAASGYDVDNSDGVVVTPETPAAFKLTFNPDTWKMKFYAKADSSVVNQVRGVRVRVLCWNPWIGENEFNPINQHKNAYLEVRPSASGTKASMELWKWDEESAHEYPDYAITKPQSYYFSLEVIGFKLADDTIVDAGDAAPVTATIKVKGGAQTGDREAVYLAAGKDGQRDAQKGKIAVVLEPRTYAVELDAAGGKIEKGSEVESYAFGKGATLPDAKHITYEHHTFKGWYTQKGDEDGNGWGEKVEQITPSEYGNRQYYAYWTVDDCKVTFVTGDSASEMKDQKVKYEDKLSKPSDPTKDGYKFTGWYTDEKCTASYDFDSKVTEDLTLYAGWEKKAEKKSSKKDSDK